MAFTDPETLRDLLRHPGAGDLRKHLYARRLEQVERALQKSKGASLEEIRYEMGKLDGLKEICELLEETDG